MKIQNSFLAGRYCANINFDGTPQRLYGGWIKNYQDALEVWENLRYAKYLDAHQNSYYDKSIRADNYSFLDKLTSYSDKAGFIEKFCSFTGFPNLRTISNKIDSTFKACINRISKELTVSNRSNEYNIIDSGYDPTCSLGLRKAFPGSDLDKGYIILEGSSLASEKAEEVIINNFKGKLWDDLDQRIVSLNHPDTYPSVYTKKQISNMLDKLDKKAQEVEANLNFKNAVGTTAALTLATLLGPIAIIGGSAIAGLLLSRHFAKAAVTTDPYVAGKFNRKIAEKIIGSKDREDAKNFAFFIETVMANFKRNSCGKNDSIFSIINNSPFAKNSNVTQVEAWQHKIDGGYMKSKLRNRIKLESDFYSMSTDTKYDLVKDVIKYGTDDQSSRFSQYFKNDDDIANRYDKLLESLK